MHYILYCMTGSTTSLMQNHSNGLSNGYKSKRRHIQNGDRPKRRHAKRATIQNGDNQNGDTIKQRRFGCVTVLVVAVLDLSPFWPVPQTMLNVVTVTLSLALLARQCGICGIWLFKESSNSLSGGQTNGWVVVWVVVAFLVVKLSMNLLMFCNLGGNLMLSTLKLYTPFLRRSMFP